MLASKKIKICTIQCACIVIMSELLPLFRICIVIGYFRSKQMHSVTRVLTTSLLQSDQGRDAYQSCIPVAVH